MTNSTFTNNPNRRAKGRIIFDIINIKSDKERLENQEGVYFKFNLHNDVLSTKYKMLLIGPEDSPYVGGFYMFDAQFPDQYPYFPMTMKSRTQGGSIRKHPNLYVNGKCCFSFLGTWAGPPWTACQNPETVGISMRSVLTNNPIINEPGWEKRDDARTKLYETMVRYFNIRYAVIKVINEIDKSPFSELADAVKRNFIKYYSFYNEEVKKFEKYNGITKKSPVYGFSTTFEVEFVKSELKRLFGKYSGEYGTKVSSEKKSSEEMEEQQVNTTDEEVVNSGESINETNKNSQLVQETLEDVSILSSKKTIKIKKKAVRKAPKKSAIHFDEGVVLIGLDSNNWKVKKYESGQKRWVKCG